MRLITYNLSMVSRMNLLFTILVFSIGFLGQLYATSLGTRPTINEICSVGRTVSRAQGLTDKINLLCSMQNNVPADNSRIFEQINSMLAALNRILEAGGEAVPTETNRAYIQLTAAFNTTLGPNRGAMRSILRTFPGPEERRANIDTYARTFRELIARTPSGGRLIRQFDAQEGPGNQYSSTVYRVLSQQEIDNGTVAMVQSERTDNGQNIRVISINPTFDPSVIAASLAHEMQHGLISNQIDAHYAEFDRIYEALEANPRSQSAQRALALATRNLDQALMLDELRAFRLESQLFKEMVEQNPDTYCHSFFYSQSMFGNQILTLGEMYGFFEQELAQNRFQDFMLPVYIDVGGFSRASFYDGTNYRRDFIQQMRSEGFAR